MDKKHYLFFMVITSGIFLHTAEPVEFEHEDPRAGQEARESATRESETAKARDFWRTRDAAIRETTTRSSTPDPETLSRTPTEDPTEFKDTSDAVSLGNNFISIDIDTQKQWIRDVRAKLKAEVAKLGDLFQIGKEMKEDAKTPTENTEKTFAVLGIDPENPTLKQITTNFRKTALLIHPDKYNPENPRMADAASKILDAQGIDHATPPTAADAIRAFQELNNMYEQVSDQEKLDSFMKEPVVVDSDLYAQGRQAMNAAKQARQVINALRSVLNHLEENTTISQEQLQSFVSEAQNAIELLQIESQGKVPHPDGVSDIETYMQNLVGDIISKANTYGDYNVEISFPDAQTAAMFGMTPSSPATLKIINDRYNTIINALKSSDPVQVQKGIQQVLGKRVVATRENMNRALKTVQKAYNTIIGA